MADENPTWGDWASVIGNIGTADVGSLLNAAGRYIAEKSGDTEDLEAYKASERINTRGRDAAMAGLSDVTRKRLEAPVTSEEFWEAPFSSTILKSLRLTPTMAAAIVPGTLFGGGAVGGTLVAGALGGGMSAADTINGIYEQVDKADDDTLRKASPYYAELRDMGMEESDARTRYIDKIRGYKPLIAFAVGAVSNAAGGAGQATRALRGGAASITGHSGGRLANTAKGFAEGAISEAIDEGTNAALTQNAAIEGGLQSQFDYGKFMDQALEGGLLGGLFSGVAGAASKPGAKSDAKRPQQTAPVEVLEPGAVSAEQQVALDTANTIPAGQATTPAPDAVPPDVAAAASRLGQGGAGGQTMAREVGVPQKVQQASQRLDGRVPHEVTPIDEEDGGFNVNLPDELRPTQDDIDASQPESEFTPPPAPAVNPVVEKIKSRAKQAAAKKAAPVDALDVPADAGLDAPISESKPRVLRPVGEEEVDPDMVAKIKPVELPKEKGSVGSKDTKKLAKRQADADATKTLFDATDLPIEFPTSDQERQTLLTKVKELIDTIERNGVTIPAKTGYKDAKNPTPDHLVWARELKDLVGVLGKKSIGATKRAERDERVNAILANWKIAKETGDFAPMRGERITAGAQKKSQAKGGNVDAIAAPVEEEVRAAERDQAVQEETAPVMEAPALAEKDNDVVQTKTTRSAARGPELFDEERAAQVAPVKKVKITDELRRQYETPGTAPVTPKGKEAVAAVKAKAAAKRKPLKKKVEEAAAQVNTDPTEAQKESGTYAKGHVNVQGLDVTLENPKGSKRKGKGPNGDWEVTMPAHYGYIKRTEGKDGDQVDVYVGDKPDSPHVLVIDQKNLDGSFDEHKVMLGFDDAVVAMDAYEKAFSDGRGLDRLGPMTQMTMDEFKTWLAKGDTKAPIPELADNPRGWERTEASDQVIGARDPARVVNHHSISVTNRTLNNGANGRRVVAESRTTFNDAFNRWVGPEGKGGFVYEFMARRVRQLAKDVPTYVISQKDMAYLYPASVQKNGLVSPAVYDPNLKAIAVTRELLETGTRDKIRATLIHEADHAITEEALRTDPKLQAAAMYLLERVKTDFDTRAEMFGLDPTRPYGLKNIFELTAEARSNAAFQKLMANTLLTEEQEAAFKALLPAPRKLRSVWDAFLELVRAALQLPGTPRVYTALEAAFELQKNAEAQFEVRQQADTSFREAQFAAPMQAFISEDVKRAVLGAAKQEQVGSPKLLGIATWNQIADAADRFFTAAKDGVVNPVRVLYNLREARRVRAENILRGSEPLLKRHTELERKYKGEVWQAYSELIHDETYAGVFADKPLDDKANAHIGKTSLDGAWSREQHPDLAAAWKKLPEDLKALRRDTIAHYTAQQNQMSLDILKNRVLAALGVNDDALAQRIFDDAATEADVKAVGGKHVMDLIQKAGALRKIKGPYYPLMRHGGYVVQGVYKVTSPGNAKVIDDNTYEFDDRDAALAYAKSQVARPTVRSVWVDQKTGKTTFEDEQGEVRVTKQDEDAVQRFRVKVQDRHVEFFETEREARRAALEYENSGKFREVKGVEHRRYEPGDLHSDMLSSDIVRLKNSLHRGEGYANMTAGQKGELDRALSEASIRFLGSNRIQTKRLPRTYVAGASRDVTRVLWDYSHSTSGYLAKLEFAPKIEAAHKELIAQVKNDASKNTSLGRTAIANEVEKRLYSDNAFGDGKAMNPALQRLLTVSFIDKLASPAYSIINATQTAMVGMPVISGRHGVGAAVAELGKAYQDISGFSLIKHGLGETGKAIRGKEHSATYLGDIKSRLKGGDLKMVEELEALGAIDGDAGLELGELGRARAGNTRTSQVLARADKGLGYIENIARQMPKAIETMNRTTVALAAYRLEMRKSGNHEKAVAYARQVVDQSQFNYSATNSSPYFNHPLGRLAFQFKKYAANMYWLIGTNVAKAYRNETPGARTEAVRTLAMIAMTHMAMAGALGLPTEPFKYLLMGAKAFGLGTPGWDDVEELVRKYSAETLGKTGGEIFSKGLPRALGIDVSSRMGLDSLIAFGEPKSDKEKDVKTWLLDTIAGAPAALVSDYIKGANYLTSGEYTKAAEKMVPLKFASDAIRAYRTASEGKKSTVTGRQYSEPYSWGEAALRTVGFTPAREAEEGAKAAAFRNQTDKARTERSRIINAWVNATGGAKVDAQRAVQKYNLSVPKEDRIETKDLTAAAKRREREGTGIVTNKKTAPKLERLDQIYQ